MKGSLKTMTIAAIAALAVAALATTPARAETAAARQASAANEGFCAAVMRSSAPPEACVADLARGIVSLVPAGARTGGAPMPAISALAHMAAVIASQRRVATAISVTETDMGLDMVTIDLDPQAVDAMSKLDNAAAASALVAARGSRCKVGLTARTCTPLAGK